MNEKKRRNFYLKVRTRQNMLFEGPISSLSSVNETGKFDVLIKHANFISLIKDYLIINLIDGTKREIKVENAILRVLDNQADVYLGVKE